MKKTIYIKNPKEGSNYRTIGKAKGTVSKLPVNPKAPKKPKGKVFIAGVTDAFGDPLYPQGKLKQGPKWDWKTNAPVEQPQFGNPYSGLDFGHYEGLGSTPEWADFQTQYPEYAFQESYVEFPTGAVFLIGGAAIALSVLAPPLALGATGLTSNMAIIAGSVGVMSVAATGTPMSTPQGGDLVSWIGEHVTTEEYVSESPISGKTTKKKIVIKP